MKEKRKAYLLDGVWRVPLTQGREALVDECDVAFAQSQNWGYSAGYAGRGATVDGRNVRILLHREIAARAGIDLSDLVDHKNLNTLDNRRDNLRAATVSGNRCNTTVRADNEARSKGVRFHKTSRVWHARIMKNGKAIHLGSFDTKDEAEAAYAAASSVFHGDFGRSS